MSSEKSEAVPTLSTRGRTWTARRGTALGVTAALLMAGPVAAGPAPVESTPAAAAPTASAPSLAEAARSAARRDVCAHVPVRTRQYARTSERPNLLLITVDDMSVKDLKHLPNIQRHLVQQGTNAANAMAPTPLCSPARASLLTGRYADNHGVLTVGDDGQGYRNFKDGNTLPVWLQDRGYTTGFVGKYLNGYAMKPRRTASGQTRPGYTYVPPGWDKWQGSIDMSTYNFSTTTISNNGRKESAKKYNTCGFAQRADRFMATQASSSKPWYLWVNYVAPHHGGPRDTNDPAADAHKYSTPSPHPRERGTFAGLRPLKTPEMFEKNTSDKVVAGTHKRWKKKHKRKAAQVRKQRLQSLATVDEVVGRHIEVLRRTGQLSNTVIGFTSDNGYQVGEHRLVGKLWHYRNSSSVPMVFRGPGIKRGHTTQTIVSNADVPVTLARMAGVPINTATTDGADLRSVLAGVERTRVVPMVAYPVAGGKRAMYRGVRVANRWNYARIGGGREELYDWSTDPYELNNLAKKPAYRQVRAELRTLTRTLASCHGSEATSATSCENAQVQQAALRLANAEI